MRPIPAGRGGTARCCSPYNAILERLDTMDVRIQQAVDDANAAMSAATIQAGNAAQSAADALTQAGIAAGKASDAAADAADAAQDAADARQALDDINDTIQTTLDNELGGKVDKLTTAGLHLYSHTGATEGEEEPIDGTTSNTIPIRDGNGRMHAADPASGATDKTLVTANWVSQTGDSAPNNLVHRTANETVYGNKTLAGITTINIFRLANTGGSGYKILYRFKNNHTQTLLMTGGRTIIVAQVLNTGGYKKVLATSGRDYTTPSWLWVTKDANTGEYYLVCHGLYSATMNIHIINSFLYGTVYPHQDDIELIDQSTTDPTTDTRWSSVTEVGNYD